MLLSLEQIKGKVSLILNVVIYQIMLINQIITSSCKHIQSFDLLHNFITY